MSDKFRPLDEYLNESWLQPERVPFLRDSLMTRIKELEAQLANDVTGREWVQLLKRSKELEATIERVRVDVETLEYDGEFTQDFILKTIKAALDRK